MGTDSKSSLGELLRQGRLRQRLSIAECAKRTHISSRYLEALEEENWTDLPSESHRLGFLRLYSRFLGVSTDEVITLYQQKSVGNAVPKEPTEEQKSAENSSSHSLYPGTWLQALGLLVLLLLVAWLLYHAVSKRLFEQHYQPVVRLPARLQQTRLVVTKQTAALQRIRVVATADSWLRVSDRHHLLFEGILPSGASKEWSGEGPYQFKIGNVKALSIFWNDQPFDSQAGAQGSVSDIQIPPNR
jgi:transcriptional regulator with XRE-family HTH domain